MDIRTVKTPDGQYHTGQVAKVIEETNITPIDFLVGICTLGLIDTTQRGTATIIDEKTGQHFTGEL